MEITDPEFNQQEFNCYVKMLYQDFPCGGPFHIVLDDGNVETSNIVFCLLHYADWYEGEWATEWEVEWLKEHVDEMSKMSVMLLELNEDDRFTAIERAFKSLTLDKSTNL